MDSEFWEPWAPVIGARVRVRLSSECDLHVMAADPAVVNKMDGQTGRVIARVSGVRKGHPYDVAIDRPFRAVHAVTKREGVVRSGLFAAVELEPIGEEVV